VGSERDPTEAQRFEREVLVHLDDLYRAAVRLTGKVPDAEDLVQETCLRAFQALSQLRHPGAAKVWVFSILRSVFLRQVTRRSARVDLVDLDRAVLSGATRNPLDEPGSAPRETLLQEVRQATLNLPVPYREAIILAHIGGFSYREMAQILEVPLGTVMSRLFRARGMLRAALQDAVRGPTKPAR
jgi:RNA polymerase sigma-70 factor, ECF subfamily